MNRIIATVISVLVLVGVVFGASRFFTGRTEIRSFEADGGTLTLGAVPEPVMETEVPEGRAVDEPELTDPADASQEHVAASTDTDPVSVGSEPASGKNPEPEVGSVSAPSIIDRLVSFGHEDRSSRNIDTIVVHSSYDALGDDPYSVSGLIEEYRQYGVSAHYLIDRKGTVYRLVEDRDIAYHAGVSAMPDGRTGVNAFSIGIEIIEKDTDSPTSAQYASLRSLIAYLEGKYGIRYVLGHSDIAPGRKTDPWGFDWERIR